MVAYTAPAGTARRDVLRWGLCFGAMAALHAGAAVALLHMRSLSDDGFVAGAAVVMIDIPETPAAMPVPDRNLAPGPEQPEQEAVPDRKEETKPPEETEVALPDPEPPKPEPPAEEKQATAPPPVTAVANAPATAGVEQPQPPSAAVRRWQSGLSAQIARTKRYPQKALARREEGRVIVAFTIDRDGKVLENRVIGSSGSSDLDQEALSSVIRAQPLPKPPRDAKDTDLSFTVGIGFARPPSGW